MEAYETTDGTGLSFGTHYFEVSFDENGGEGATFYEESVEYSEAEQSYRCEECQVTVSTLEDFLVHPEHQARDCVSVFSCPITSCSKVGCITLRAYKMHAKCVHKSPNLTPIVKNMEAKYICQVRGCGKLFVEDTQLEVHLKHHETYTPRRGKYVCDICNEDSTRHSCSRAPPGLSPGQGRGIHSMQEGSRPHRHRTQLQHCNQRHIPRTLQ
ncbi:Uncharacterized protein FKW44_023892 [Caligus rogercresseyi]|uniref:C2H2-type domain-containing protein n=1 Tax=Caligus rogercresseyi TaxID=217165 RepID=A0A7T8GQ23_CALRO|nr:Uncharacterized protein FKW44_023892 [Caligus rogercresseyi]